MRIKILIEYDGTDFVGWQKQINGKSVQGEIENCLEKIFNQKIKLFVAGRTDSGVHANGQVAHFDIDKTDITPEKIFLAINYYLKLSKNNISILDSKKVSTNFHARFSAKLRIYEYQILNRKVNSPLMSKKVWFIPYKIDRDLIIRASKLLIGKHDFNSFRSTKCQAKNSIRSIKDIKIVYEEEKISINVHGKSFLHNQVRIIVGSLINVARNYWTVEELGYILESKDRRKAGPTAPAHGLYLKKIIY